MNHPLRLLFAVALLLLPQPAPLDWRTAAPGDWQTLFNGRDLDGWVVKLAHHDLGDNYADTFRVENGAIRVMYDKYGEFGARFGHLFYKQKLSHYVLALEYRFFGEQARGGPGYAKLNSGVMVHSQAPESILKDQDWPISVEAQFLAGNRMTMNVCTPGTEIEMKGVMVKDHCVNSTSRPYGDDGWVAVEVEVLGAERVRHMIGGAVVLQYEHPTIGGGVATGFDPAIKKDGAVLADGYIGLQAESQPVEFRNIRLLNLAGCMNPASPAYRPYSCTATMLVAPDRDTRLRILVMAASTRRTVPALLAIAAITSAALFAQSSPLPNRPDSLKFAAIGDNGTGDQPQYDVAKQMAAFHERFAYDLVIMLGDNMYGGQSPADFVKKFEQPYAPLLKAGVKFQASLGNHDRPENVWYGPYNMNGRRYYSFVRQNARFLALDSTQMDRAQLEWIETSLGSAREDWKICYFHHPLYSNANRHGSSVDLRILLEPILVRHGVDVVFSGHDHVYERLKPQKGIHYFVSGSAGQLRKGNMSPTDQTAAYFDQDQSFMLVEIAGADMFFQTISRSGKTVDSGVIHRQTTRSQP